MKHLILLFILISVVSGNECEMLLDVDKPIVNVYEEENTNMIIKTEEYEVDVNETIPEYPIVLPELSRATDCIVYDIIKSEEWGRVGFLNISEVLNISMNLSRMGGNNGSRNLFRLNKSTSFV